MERGDTGAPARRAPAHAWVRARADRTVLGAADTLLGTLAAHLSTATGDAVTVRALSPDGRLLLPVAAHDVDADRREAMGRLMTMTASVDEGLWRPVIQQRAPRRWQIPAAEPPGEASPEQRDFMARYPVRAVLGAPLLVGDDLVGGVSLVRFSVTTPFTVGDEDLVVDLAVELAAVVRLRSVAVARLTT